MFKCLLIPLFFLSWSTISLASLVLVDGKDFYKVGFHLDILEDQTGLLTISDVTKEKMSLKFKKSTFFMSSYLSFKIVFLAIKRYE